VDKQIRSSAPASSAYFLVVGMVIIALVCWELFVQKERHEEEREARIEERTAAAQTELRAAEELAAIAALGKRTDAEARDFLVWAATDRFFSSDERLAAIRALRNLKHPRATDTLLDVLRTEQDPALQAEAHESLMAATGKKLPLDANAWERELHPEKMYHQTVETVKQLVNSPTVKNLKRLIQKTRPQSPSLSIPSNDPRK
jgi:HEAT repeats